MISCDQFIRDFDGFHSDPLRELNRVDRYYAPYFGITYWLREEALKALSGINRDQFDDLTRHIQSVFKTDWPAFLRKSWPDLSESIPEVYSPGAVLLLCDRWYESFPRQAHYAAIILMLVDGACQIRAFVRELPLSTPEPVVTLLQQDLGINVAKLFDGQCLELAAYHQEALNRGWHLLNAATTCVPLLYSRQMEAEAIRAFHQKGAQSTNAPYKEAEAFCVAEALTLWKRRPALRISRVVEALQTKVSAEYGIQVVPITIKRWLKAASKSGLLDIPLAASRKGKPRRITTLL